MFLCAVVLFLAACKDKPSLISSPQLSAPLSLKSKEIKDKNSWLYFLQHLPEKEGPVLDYKGNPVSYQQKHTSIVDYDIGNRDLQQCADALMRLRAEYLFSQQRFAEIHFHFTSGHDYSFPDYCQGKRPVPDGNTIRFISVSPVAVSHQSLRRYLDIVYTYAGTISLSRELRNTDRFTIGTVVITPGSPGHCFIIVDEAITASGDTVYKLVEGYSPAQSIYILQNLEEPQLGYWHRLWKGPIQTATYTFENYQLKKIE
jgi:hypothetical protein